MLIEMQPIVMNTYVVVFAANVNAKLKASSAAIKKYLF
jgi:hypothetical protein